MFRDIGPMEIVLILAVLVLLFGAKKLPDLARGSGRALRIFKSETKGLLDDEDDADKKSPEQAQIDALNESGASSRTESVQSPIKGEARPDKTD